MQQKSAPIWLVVSILCGMCLVSGCKKEEPVVVKKTSLEVIMPTGLPEMPIPDSNPLTAEKIALGRELFFDPLLSADKSVSCASCHDPQKGWSNGEALAKGVGGKLGKRNSVTILNSGFQKRLFWDGRATSLEQQVLIPIFNPDEMGLKSEEELIERIESSKEYVRRFKEAFDDGVSVANVAKAIACFERTLVVGDTPFDRYVAGDKNAMSESAVRGMELFFNSRRANCGGCHATPLFTDQEYYNTGIGMDKPDPDLGYHHTLGRRFFGAFRSPSLRGIASTAPYMHDGSLATLEDVVEYYARGGNRNKYIDPGVKRLRLNAQNKSDLVQFLREGLGSTTSNGSDGE